MQSNNLKETWEMLWFSVCLTNTDHFYRGNYQQELALLWPHLHLVMTSHLETGKVEAETKGLYDHGCPTTQGTLTHTASPPATDHPGAAHVNSETRHQKDTLQHAQRRQPLYWHELHTCHEERGPWMRFSVITFLRCCSASRSSCWEQSNLQQLSVDECKWMLWKRVGTAAKNPGCPETQICRDDTQSQ